MNYIYIKVYVIRIIEVGDLERVFNIVWFFLFIKIFMYNVYIVKIYIYKSEVDDMNIKKNW